MHTILIGNKESKLVEHDFYNVNTYIHEHTHALIYTCINTHIIVSGNTRLRSKARSFDL